MFSEVIHRFHTLYLRLTEPHTSVTSAQDRYSIRLFSLLMLTLLMLVVLLEILPYLPVMFTDPNWLSYQIAIFATCFIFYTAYRLARRGYYRQMSLIVSTSMIIIILVASYPDMGMWELNYLGYILLPLILSCMFLPLRYSWAQFGFAFLGVILIWLTSPDLDLITLILEPFGIVIVVFFMLIIATRYFRQVESERTTQEVETERLKLALEKERELSQFKDHIMATISHEFRTPLSAIFTSTELLEGYSDRLPPERRAELLHRIQGQVQSLTDMVSEVALMRRMQGGSFPLEFTLLDLRAFLLGIIQEFETFSAPDHLYSLAYNVPEPMVRVDIRLLRHIIVNLLSNAAKYSSSGTPIRIQVDRNEQWLFLVVEDKGAGIKMQDRERIFEPFFRGENAALATGTGLGLKIVKDCVALYGGEINFTSEEGGGTRFAVRLPLSLV